MGRKKSKTPDSGPGPGQEFKPGKADEAREEGILDRADSTTPGPTQRSEDFGRRRDIETADEPVEEHDRRHHDEEAEVGRPT
jgi:hypothetical protein